MNRNLIILWLMVLPLGVIYLNGYPAPPLLELEGVGRYTGHLQGLFLISGQRDVLSYHVSGESIPNWSWELPENHTYEQLELKWHGKHADRAVVNLLDMTMTIQGQVFQAVPGVLSLHMLGVAEAELEPIQRQALERLELLFHQAAKGELPSAHHPGHQTPYTHHHDDALGGEILHQSSGYGVPHEHLYWLVLWCGVTGLCMIYWSFTKGSDHPSSARSSVKSIGRL